MFRSGATGREVAVERILEHLALVALEWTVTSQAELLGVDVVVAQQGGESARIEGLAPEITPRRFLVIHQAPHEIGGGDAVEVRLGEDGLKVTQQPHA